MNWVCSRLLKVCLHFELRLFNSGFCLIVTYRPCSDASDVLCVIWNWKLRRLYETYLNSDTLKISNKCELRLCMWDGLFSALFIDISMELINTVAVLSEVSALLTLLLWHNIMCIRTANVKLGKIYPICSAL